MSLVLLWYSKVPKELKQKVVILFTNMIHIVVLKKYWN